jgi:hypothetical protein
LTGVRCPVSYGRMPDEERHSRPPLLLLGGFALFIAVTAYLVITSMAKRSVPTFDPSPRVTASPDSEPRHDDTITVDATDSRRWQFVDFDRGGIVAPPDTAGWDLAVRRYHVIASDAIADLGSRRFEDVRDVPESGFIANVAGDDTSNAAIRRWYKYSMVTHLLEPTDHAYAVRTLDARFAIVQILGYYCTGLRPGCLTLRYTYPVSTPWAGRRAALSRE